MKQAGTHDRVPTGLTFLAMLLSLATSLIPSTLADAQPRFPIVFTKMSDLQALGLSLDWPPPWADPTTGDANPLAAPRFANTCYWYAGPLTDYVISVSDEFLAAYTAKGFSRESLCMALVSEARFDPETGKRLATYMYRDVGVLARHLAEIKPTQLSEDRKADFIPLPFASEGELDDKISRVLAGDFTGLTDDQANVLIPYMYSTKELPLTLPPCFKNGTPMQDCTWRYDLITGKKLSKVDAANYRQVGALLYEQIHADIARGTGQRMHPAQHRSQEAYLQIDRALSPATNFEDNPNDAMLHVLVPDDLFTIAGGMAWYAVSPNLPQGYGYALNAYSEGFGDGGISVASLKAAFGGSSGGSKLDISRLKALLQ